MNIKQFLMTLGLLTLSGISWQSYANKYADYTHSILYYGVTSNDATHSDQWCRKKYSSKKYLKINDKGIVVKHNLDRKYIKEVASRSITSKSSLSLITTDMGFSSVYCQKNVNECEGIFYNKYCHGSFSTYHLHVKPCSKK